MTTIELAKELERISRSPGSIYVAIAMVFRRDEIAAVQHVTLTGTTVRQVEKKLNEHAADGGEVLGFLGANKVSGKTAWWYKVHSECAQPAEAERLLKLNLTETRDRVIRRRHKSRGKNS
jgi:hypothetical protein